MRVKKRLALGIILFLTATVFVGSAVAEPILEKIERTGSGKMISKSWDRIKRLYLF